MAGLFVAAIAGAAAVASGFRVLEKTRANLMPMSVNKTSR